MPFYRAGLAAPFRNIFEFGRGASECTAQNFLQSRSRSPLSMFLRCIGATMADDNAEWMEFLSFMALTSLDWQRVEDMHYLLFNKMVQTPNDDICSILYYQPPSFEGKRTLVDRLAQLYLPKDFHGEWSKLNKRLKNASEQRGSVAHYSLDFETTKGPTRAIADMQIGAPRLVPSPNNKIDEMKGRVRSKEKYIVTTKKMRDYVLSFRELSEDLKKFILKIPDRPPRSSNPLATALLGPKWKWILRPS
jgi:hypothetical protein